MHARSWRLAIASLSTGALGLGGILAVASPASATFSGDAYTGMSASGYAGSSTNCATSTTPSSDRKDVTDNGGAVTVSKSGALTVTHPSATTDITDVTATSSATTTASPITGGPASIQFSGSASVTAKPRLATSQCTTSASSRAETYGTIELPVAMNATLSGSASGAGGINLSLSGNDDANENIGVNIGVGSGSVGSTIYLPAGRYSYDADITASLYGVSTGSRSASTTGTGTLTLTPLPPAAAPAQSGAAYAKIGARNCKKKSVTVSLTKAVKGAKKVQLKAGKKTRTLKGKQLKPRKVTFHGLPKKALTVSAVITTKKGAKASVTRSFPACRT